MGLQATEESKESDERYMIWRDIYEMITLDDGTNWILIGDHWIEATLTNHADWCGCDMLK